MNKCRWIALVVTFAVCQVGPGAGCTRTLVHVEPEHPRASKKAVLMLPGLRNTAKGHQAAQEWYPAQGYDVFVPDYVSREGFAGSVANLAAFIEEQRLAEYEEVYAFVFLMGGWTLNMYLEEHDLPNLTTIVYDRSPLQEQAPRIVLETIPAVIHMLYGEATDQLRDTPYPPLPKGERRIGIIVENRASPFVRRHCDELEPIAYEDWLPEAFDQEHDDLIYVYLHHDELYYSYDEIGDDLQSFFETGRFTEGAARKPIDRDPFE
ncbi:MAG: hypothetical protein JRF63_14800 [Deltaproteobacteria bacterium]|nr:hypothetical protein [Deltaproteobacteria bacterium]